MKEVDIFTPGARLALELECLLMDTRNDAAQSRWWDSAHEALEQWRQAVRAMEASTDAGQPAAVDGTQKGVVAWARLVYARPVNAPEPAEEWDEVVDIEFHTRPEKPEGEGWRPLVIADTCDGTAPLPRINVKCETVDNGIAGSTYLEVIRVEQEDDGSLTAVIEPAAWTTPR